jgi:hypothetical protein
MVVETLFSAFSGEAKTFEDAREDYVRCRAGITDGFSTDKERFSASIDLMFGLGVPLCTTTASADRAMHVSPSSAKTGLSIHDFPVRVLADHLAIAERIEVATLDLLSRALAGGACEGPF